MQHALNTFIAAILRCLPDAEVSAYLYGSVPLGDYCPGWSDIDLLVLTRRPLTPAEAESLVPLRQSLLAQEPRNPYYRAIEGGVTPLDGLLTGESTPVTYWGTSGQRVKQRHDLGPLEMWQVHHQSRLLCGADVRNRLPCPAREELLAAVGAHLGAIRQYATSTGASLYTFGWMLDIARGLYTVEMGTVIAKTAAGLWALERHLCPDEEALRMAIDLRRDPSRIAREEVRDAALALEVAIQRFADVLEQAL